MLRTPHYSKFFLPAALSLITGTATASDAAVKDASEGFRLGEFNRVQAALPKVRGHVLESYVEYWALRYDLSASSGAEVERFIKRFDGSAIADRLRVDWLKQLGKTEQWAEFNRWGAGFETDDSEVACYRATILSRDASLTAAVPSGVWAERLTEACAQAFAALAAKNRVTTEDSFWRFRTSADGATLVAAQRAADALPESAQPTNDTLQRAHSNPDLLIKQVATIANPSRAQREAALYALTKLSRTDVSRARSLWLTYRSKFTDDEQRYAAAQLAYSSAKRLETDEAMTWLKRAGAEQDLARLGDWQAAWIVRAALREGLWGEVLHVINAMSPATNGGQNDPAWRYWKARALAELGDRVGATAIWTELAKDFSFYGLLAADDIRAPLPPAETLKNGAVKPSAEQMKRFDQSAAARRVLKLSELGLRADAAREWFSVVKEFGDTDSLIASEWMRSKGLWDRSINTAERTKTQHDFSLRFQMPYADEIRKAASAVNLDHALTFGLIRQESRFWAEAVSSAGALGLMQVMPATGKWIAQQLGVKDYRPSQLTDINVSTGFGAFYLKNALNTQANSEVLASAAYNAGGGRARQWRDERRALEGAIYAESIPFNETRDYVKKVLANAVWYAHLYGNGETSIKKRLGTIAPKS